MIQLVHLSQTRQWLGAPAGAGHGQAVPGLTDCAQQQSKELARCPGVALSFVRLCISGVEFDSSERKARGRLKSGLFHARCIALVAPVSMVARAGRPSGLPVPFFRSVNPALGRHPRLTARAAVVDDRKKGATTMAVDSMGASAPYAGAARQSAAAAASGTAGCRASSSKTRTRRPHGLFTLGAGLVAAIHTSRRRVASSAGSAGSVILSLNAGRSRMEACMTHRDARSIAGALVAAAEQAQQAERAGAVERAHQLRAEIHNHNARYELGYGTISDAAFDGLFAELQALEEAHPEAREAGSPTLSLPHAALPGAAKRTHAAPVLSLRTEPDTSPAGALSCDARIRRLLGLAEGAAPLAYHVSTKVDGVALVLRYEHGCLVHAATRGDGHAGEDVTAIAREVLSIPRFLTTGTVPVLEVRGELFMRRLAFGLLCKALASEGKPCPSSARAHTASRLQLLEARTDPNRALAVAQHLSFVTHGLVHAEGWPAPASHLALLMQLEALGLPVADGQAVVAGADGIAAAFAARAAARASLCCDADGVVFTLDDRTLQATLGATGRAPRHAFAFKWSDAMEGGAA